MSSTLENELKLPQHRSENIEDTDGEQNREESLVKQEIVDKHEEKSDDPDGFKDFLKRFSDGLVGLAKRYNDQNFNNEANLLMNVVETSYADFISGRIDREKFKGAITWVQGELESLIKVFDPESPMRIVASKEDAYKTYIENNRFTI